MTKPDITILYQVEVEVRDGPMKLIGPRFDQRDAALMLCLAIENRARQSRDWNWVNPHVIAVPILSH